MNFQKIQLISLWLLVLVLLGDRIYSLLPKNVDETENSNVSMRLFSKKMYRFELLKEADFCGEKTPLEDQEVAEKLDRELVTNAYWQANTALIMKRAGKWFGQIEPILKTEGVPDDFKYLMVIESAVMNDVSPAGATGFWQFMEKTAQEYGLEVNEEVDERYNPLRATQAACSYLKTAYGKFANWTNVAASYNMGMAGLMREQREQQKLSYYDLYLNRETSRYVYRILALKEIMKNPKKYHFDMGTDDLYKPENTRKVVVTESIKDLVSFAIEQGTTYKTLKTLNPWLRKQQLTIRKPNQQYEILLPKN